MPDRVNAYGQPIGPALPDWQPRPWPPSTPMVGRFCRIEPVDPDRDAAGLFEAYAEAPDDRDWTYLASERPSTPEACRTYLAGHRGVPPTRSTTRSRISRPAAPSGPRR